MEEVHHHEVLLEGDEDRLLGEVHQEVHHGSAGGPRVPGAAGGATAERSTHCTT